MKKKVLIVLIILVLWVLFHIHTSESLQRYQLVSHTLSSVWFWANTTWVNVLHNLNKECLEEDCDLFDYSIWMAYFFSWLATYSGTFDMSQMYSWWVIDVTQLDLFVEKKSQKIQQTERSLWKRHWIQKWDMQSILFPDREKSIEYLWYVFSWSEIGTKALHNRTIIQKLIDTKKIEQEKQEEAQKKQKQREEEKEEQHKKEEWEGSEQDWGDTSDRENKQEENTDEGNNESEGEWDQDENKQEQKDWSQGEWDKQEDQEPTLSENTKEQLQEYAEQLQQQEAQQQQYFNKKPQNNSQQPQDLFEALFGRQHMRQEVDTGGEVDW